MTRDGNTPLVSVVLITHNGSATIGDQLDAVRAQSWDQNWELVVVDNASTDGTAELVRRLVDGDDRVRLITASDRASAGYARNAGVRAARGRFVAFVDDDDVVGEGWLRSLGGAVVQHDYVAGRLEIERLNPPVVRRARNPAQQDRLDEFCGVPVSAAPLVAVRRDWILDVGGFDETIWPEDTDLALRLFAAHRRGPVFCPDAVYHYRLRSDASGILRQSFRYGRVRPLLLQRWHEILEPPRGVVRAAVLEWLRLVVSLPRCFVDPSRRLAWIRRVGTRSGHLAGSIRYRVLWP